MKRYCINLDCSEHQSRFLENPKSGRVVKKGTFYRQCDRRYIQRFKCLICRTDFSKATFDENYRQRLRQVNRPLMVLYCSGVSQRRVARVLDLNQKTVQRKIKMLKQRARFEHEEWLEERFQNTPIDHIQFDDMETAEHSKCKPLSITLAVHAKTREILDFQVKQMPAKGLLSRIAKQKYGPRKDERREGWDQLFLNLKKWLQPHALIESDENPHYRKPLKRHFPKATHIRYPGARGAIVGQGELKKKAYDPLFALNHTAAMLRANMNRLFRRTWCTTKKKEGLIDHLWLYVRYHNQELIGQPIGI